LSWDDFEGTSGEAFVSEMKAGDLRDGDESSDNARLDLGRQAGQFLAARKTEVALALAPENSRIHNYLTAMANRHRAEVEWGRAEVIKLMNAG